MGEFNFTFEQIPDEQSIWADLLTSWAASGCSMLPDRRVGAILVPLITEAKPDLPSLDLIRKSQEKNLLSEKVMQDDNL